MRVTRAVGASLALALTVCGLVAVQQWQISSTNFGGSDEWLILDLSALGVLSVPYQNRPLTYLWQQPPASLWPGGLRAFWLWAGVYVTGIGLLTASLARRLAPRSPRLALLAGAVAASWAPRDELRLDTVLICGYLGATLATLLGVLLFEESWRRGNLVLLGAAAGIGIVATMTVESTLPVLATAPLLVRPDGGAGSRRWWRWIVAWEAAMLVAGLRVALAAVWSPSYQIGALGLDAAPWRVAGRLLSLVRMQAGPFLEPRSSQVFASPAVLAAGVLVVGWLVTTRLTAADGPAPRPREGLRLLTRGLLLCLAAHVTMALTQLKTPARTQILSAPGFAVALVGLAALVAGRLPPRLRAALPLAVGVWVAAVGTGRVMTMQSVWNAEGSAFAAQRRCLAGLTAAAPALAPGTLLLLLDEPGAWRTGFTFRHAIRYLYGGQVVGLAYGAADFLYPYRLTAQGVAVVPWPVIRRDWGVAPSFHKWSEVVVARASADGAIEVLQEWPSEVLPALAPGAGYDPDARILSLPVRERQRRILSVLPGS